MKKIKYIILIVLLCTGCQSNHSQHIFKNIKIPIHDFTEIIYQDNTGFFGDGEIYSVISFSHNNMEEDIQKSPYWHTLPFSFHIQTFLNNYVDNNFFPQIKQGYWYFHDRQDQAKKPFDEQDLLNRYSYNVTLALYDTQKQKLYYLELNT